MTAEGRIEDITEEYYKKMLRIYRSYNQFKEFSIIEDFLLNRDDYLSNNDLEEIEKYCYFKTKPSNISNKKIVQLIRDAFNHNDQVGTEKFKISENGKYFEIKFKDVRTDKEKLANLPQKTIIIKLDNNCLFNISRIISEKKQNVLFLSYDIPDDFNIYADNLDRELDKIKIIITRK